MLGSDIARRQVAHVGIGVGLQRGVPLLLVLGVSPGRAWASKYRWPTIRNVVTRIASCFASAAAVAEAASRSAKGSPAT